MPSSRETHYSSVGSPLGKSSPYEGEVPVRAERVSVEWSGREPRLPFYIGSTIRPPQSLRDSSPCKRGALPGRHATGKEKSQVPPRPSPRAGAGDRLRLYRGKSSPYEGEVTVRAERVSVEWSGREPRLPFYIGSTIRPPQSPQATAPPAKGEQLRLIP